MENFGACKKNSLVFAAKEQQLYQNSSSLLI